MPPKLLNYLIIVWSVVCLSGLAIFMFETYGPGSDVNSPAYLESPLVTIGFWLAVWIMPTIILVLAARRHKSSDD